MKKALVLLSLALLVCAMLTVISSAAFVSDPENGVGAYVRFDSQLTLDQRLSLGKDTSASIVYFDAEEIALRKINKNPRWNAGTDSQLWIATGSVDVIKYPYMRVTYMAPTTDIRGEANFSTVATDTYLLNEAGDAYADGLVYMPSGDGSRLSITVDGEYHRSVFNWSKHPSFNDLDSFMAGGIDIRLPLEPTALSDIYVYDIGFFATAEAAASYNYEQEYYLMDFSDSSSVAGWTVTQGGVGDTTGEYASTVEHVADEDGFMRFTQGKIDHDGTAFTRGPVDSRLSSPAIDNREWFSFARYPYFSAYMRTTVDEGQTIQDLKNDIYLLDPFISATDNSSDILSGETYIFCQFDVPVNSGNWQIFTWNVSADAWSTPRDLSGAAVLRHTFDPFENATDYGNEANTAPGNPYNPTKDFKYIAYYPNADMASKRAQPAPVGLTAVAPETAESGAKGKIMGATTDMQYRKTGESWNDVTLDMAENGIPADVATAYHVRYKAKDGYNAGYVASIAVPVTWEYTYSVENDEPAVLINNEDTVSYDTTIDPETKNITVVVPYQQDMTKLHLRNYGTLPAKSNWGGLEAHILVKTDATHVNPGDVRNDDMFKYFNGLNADGTPTQLTLSVFGNTYDEVTLTIIQENPYGVEIPTIGYNDAFANGVNVANAENAIATYVYPLLNEAVTVATCEVAEPTGADPFYKINFTLTGSKYLYTMRVVPVAIDGATLGSQIRKVGDTVDAIRFGTQINNFQTIKSDASDWGFEVQRGTLVTSNTILGGATLDHAFANGNEDVADVAGTVLYSGTEESDEIIYTAAVEGIPADEHDTALVARGYINICYNGKVVYTKYFESKTASVNDVIDAVENWEK